MATERLEGEPGFVLHSRGYQEHALLLDLYTLSRGHVRAVDRRARGPRSRHQACLQPFVPLTLSLSRGHSDLYTLRDVEAAGRPYALGMPRLLSGIYLNELLYHLTHATGGDTVLFGSYLSALADLAGGADEGAALRRFEEVLLESLGYAVRYETTDGHPLDPLMGYAFIPEQGFVPRPREAQGAFGGDELIALARGERRGGRLLSIERSINRRAIDRLLGDRPLHSRELYRRYVTSQQGAEAHHG
ncbi:MAG: DNA repair protein RecO [Succinivibrionaceae bacterium]|nr:DNA repair protein RecO [Succinivibrionaceae bacterium]